MCNKITRIIHQIWSEIDEPLPKHFKMLSKTWKKDYPDWRYEYWNNTKMNNFVLEHYPEYWNMYKSFPYNVQRWDTIRYLILYKMGGMYVDFDYQSLEPMDILIENRECCFAEEEAYINEKGESVSYFNNALIFSVPGHPFIKMIIDTIFLETTNLPITLQKNEYVLNTTGPGMISRLYTVLSPLQKKSIYIIPAKYVTPFSVGQAKMVRNGYKGPEIEECLKDAYAIHYFWGGWL